MTKRHVVMAATVALLLAVLFPPWWGYRGSDDWWVDSPGGWGFLFDIPNGPAVIDYGRLVLELVGIAAVAAGVFYLAKSGD